MDESDERALEIFREALSEVQDRSESTALPDAAQVELDSLELAELWTILDSALRVAGATDTSVPSVSTVGEARKWFLEAWGRRFSIGQTSAGQ